MLKSEEFKMRQNYFCVLKKDLGTSMLHYISGDTTLIDSNPDMSGKVLYVSRDYKLEHDYKFEVRGMQNLYGYIPESCIESLIKVDPNEQKYFVDRDGLEIPIADTQKKWDAVNHINPSIEHQYMIHEILYNMWYAADGLKFDKAQGKVFMNKQDAIDVLDKNRHLTEITNEIFNLDEEDE
ncbi:hypothetical protein HOS79_gp042 [Lactobacillus phage Nyseid]|uniref:Uncharacterized protein n=1 Tax=Lactobacillus phage Nyseid TaxID=2079432 RepID=A0A2K9VC52_9CAUD|nr:hypothetical protein HOS79_gp042 [Lactobacillus phage Nyseid]AUV59802.1 hypothetical protein [Lactobacillus phage Nyseid]